MTAGSGFDQGGFLTTVAQVLLKQDGLPRGVLESLDEEPHRRSELEPLLEGRGDASLDMCLRFLQEESLIEQTTDAREDPVVHRYELSPLGKEVISFIGKHSTGPTDL